MIISYGPWLPDQPRFGNTCVTATNVYPTKRGYGPFAGASAFSDALAASCVGAISFRRVDGVREEFAGTAANLYRLNGTTWTDVTNTGGYQNSTFWRFTIYGDFVIATNGIDNPQTFDVTSDTTFSDLANAPVHRFPIVIRDVLVALDVQDGSGFEVKFTGVNDSTGWDTASGGGSQNLPDGGPVVGGTGGEFGTILQESGLTRMNFVGGDLRFTFDKIEGSIGCIDPESIVEYKGRTFYLSEEGFQVFDGVESQNISNEMVTDTFFANLDRGEVRVTDTPENRVTDAGADVRVTSDRGWVEGALDPRNSSVVWSYPITSATTTKLIIYNYQLGQWSESNAVISCLHNSFQRTGNVLAGFDSNNKLAFFNGADLTSTVSTGELQLIKERGSFVRAVRGLVDSAHNVTVGKKTDLADTETTASGTSNSNGKVSLRSNGRYHRFQVQPTATFTELTGIDVEYSASGRKL